jgi:hypothetical protein
MDNDGGNLRRLVSSASFNAGAPDWSPAGNQIVFFMEYPDESEAKREICIINTDGSGLRRLTDDLSLDNDQPTWALNDTKPVARDDSYTANAGATLVITSPGVCVNDGNGWIGDLTSFLVNDVKHGTLYLAPTGYFNYTPLDSFSGMDSFAYKVNDGRYDSNIANVTITVKQNKFAFISQPQSVVAGSVSRAIMVQRQNNSGDSIDLNCNTDLAISTNASAGRFDIDANGLFENNAIKTVIPPGKTYISVYYKSTQIGPNTITASSPGYEGASQQIDIIAGALPQIRVETLPDGRGDVVPAQNLTAGSSLTVYAVIRDEHGNFIENGIGDWSLVNISGVSANDLVPSQDKQSAIFTGYKAGTARVRVTITGQQSVDSGLLSVVAGSGASYSVSGFPSSVLVNTPVQYTLTAIDLWGNTVNNYSRTVHFTSSDSQAMLPDDYTFTSTDKGTHSFQAILNTVGTQSITATEVGSPAVKGSQNGIVVQPSASNDDKLVLTTNPQSVTAGSASGVITIQTQNSSGTPVNVSADAVISLASTSIQGRFDTSNTGSFDGSVAQVTIPTGHNQASFYYKDTRAGTSTITASCSGYTNISQAVTVTAAVASQVRVETKADGSGTVVPAQTVYIGKNLTVYSITRDQYGNYVGNPETNWSLTNISGGVLATDLSASSGPSVTFTGSKAGSAVIHAEITDLTSVDSGALTVKKKSSSTGSGGGGGGAPPPAAPSLQVAGLNTASPVTMNTDGTTKAAAQYKTGDGKLSLDITAGTKLTNSTGATLTTLSAAVLANPPAAPEGNAILLAYELGPEGAAFTPALTLTFSYGTLPEGAKDLQLVYWNGSIWEQVEASVDAAKGTVTASISHFSQYALVYQLPTPANIAFTGITISPQTVKADDKVTIQASVTNSGDLSGSYKLVLKINDRQVDSKEVMVAGGKTENVSFEVQRGIEAEYTVDVNGQKGRFTVGTPVETPPPATVAEAVVTPTPARTNDPVPAATTKPVTSTATIAAPVSTIPSPAASSASPAEDKPTPAVLWIVLGAVAVIALIMVMLVYQSKRRNSRTQ